LQNFQDEYVAGKRDQELPPIFSTYVDAINGLLNNVELRVEGETFVIYSRLPVDGPLATSGISSGESELIALSIEALVFSFDVIPSNRGLLLVDEPDVHLHPDLQARWIAFLVGLVDKHAFDVVIATHMPRV
jgi:predicted ATPase